MKKKLLTIGLAALAVVGLCGCSKKDDTDATPEEDPTVEVEDKTDVTDETDGEDEVLASVWAGTDSLEEAEELSGVEVEFGESDKYKLEGYYATEGGVAAVYSDEEGTLIEVRKVTLESVENTLADLGTEADYDVASDAEIEGTPVTVYSNNSEVLPETIMIWADVTADEAEGTVDHMYAVKATSLLAETALEELFALVK